MTAYEMRISDWSSDVCSSDLDAPSTTPAMPSVEFTTSVGASATLRAAEHDDEGGYPSEDQDHPADERRRHQWPEARVVVVIFELLPSIRASVGCAIEQREERDPALGLRAMATGRRRPATAAGDDAGRRQP